MSKVGESVIVTQDNVNRVGVILDKYVVNKRTVYDILLENRSAVCMITSSPDANVFLNKSLTERLCASDQIISTIPYKELLEQDLLPVTKS